MNNLDKSLILPVKIYITSTPTGFACGIEEEEMYHSDKYYVTLTLARGLLRLLTKNPDFVFENHVFENRFLKTENDSTPSKNASRAREGIKLHAQHCSF